VVISVDPETVYVPVSEVWSGDITIGQAHVPLPVHETD
jgi:hypothetical protein